MNDYTSTLALSRNQFTSTAFCQFYLSIKSSSVMVPDMLHLGVSCLPLSSLKRPLVSNNIIYLTQYRAGYMTRLKMKKNQYLDISSLITTLFSSLPCPSQSPTRRCPTSTRRSSLARRHRLGTAAWTATTGACGQTTPSSCCLAESPGSATIRSAISIS